MPVAELQRRMSSREFTYWVALARVESAPAGGRRTQKGSPRPASRPEPEPVEVVEAKIRAAFGKSR